MVPSRGAREAHDSYLVGTFIWLVVFTLFAACFCVELLAILAIFLHA